jgi:calcineurin-like phosphoesterase family protein
MSLDHVFGESFSADNSFFTSDNHINHKNICKGVSSWNGGYRDFKCLDEMNEAIIGSINKVVPENGILFDLGDGLFGDKKQAVKYRRQINCKTIYRLYGNHCEWLRKDKGLQAELFAGCGDYLEIRINRKLLCLFHYAPAVWNESHRGSWFLYGHSHGSFPDRLYSNSIDVGMDCEYGLIKNKLVMTTNFHTQYYLNSEQETLQREVKLESVIHERFRPFTFNEISTIMSFKQHTPVDHHSRKDMQ